MLICLQGCTSLTPKSGSPSAVPSNVPTDLDITSGLFTGQPCKAPCWNNLTPGLSTGDDVNNFIDILSKNGWTGRDDRFYESGCQSIRISDIPGHYVNKAVEFKIQNQKLTFIESVPEDTPTLGEIVDHFGDPEYIEAILAVGPEGSGHIFNVFYPTQGLAFDMLIGKNNTDPIKENIGYITRDMKVFTIQYFPPGDLLSYLTVKDSCYVGQDGAVENAQNAIAKYVQSWTGFGEVNWIPSK